MKTFVLLLFVLSVLVTVPIANADCSPGEVFIPVGDVLHCGPDPSNNGDYNCWWEQWGICLPPYYGLTGSAQRAPGSGFARTAVVAADVAKVPAPRDPAAEVPGFSALGVGSSRAPWDVLHQLRPAPVKRGPKNALHGASAPPDPNDGECWPGDTPCGTCGWNPFCYLYCC